MIKINEKEITPNFNNKSVSRVVFNNKQVYPNYSSEGISPDTAPNGVYVYGSNNLLYDPRGWSSNITPALGVALITDNSRFIIDKSNYSTGLAWGDGSESIDGLTPHSDFDSAISEFTGKENTRALLDSNSNNTDTIPAIYTCSTFTLSTPSGDKSGYVLSCGEGQELLNNLTEIDSALTKIEGVTFASLQEQNILYQWTSSLGPNKTYAWFLHYPLSRPYYDPTTNNSSEYFIRPVYSLD